MRPKHSRLAAQCLGSEAGCQQPRAEGSVARDGDGGRRAALLLYTAPGGRPSNHVAARRRAPLITRYVLSVPYVATVPPGCNHSCKSLLDVFMTEKEIGPQ
eukprot:6190291-Pleurochrysis_carterae.AAC.1